MEINEIKNLKCDFFNLKKTQKNNKCLMKIKII